MTHSQSKESHPSSLDLQYDCYGTVAHCSQGNTVGWGKWENSAQPGWTVQIMSTYLLSFHCFIRRAAIWAKIKS